MYLSKRFLHSRHISGLFNASLCHMGRTTLVLLLAGNSKLHLCKTVLFYLLSSSFSCMFSSHITDSPCQLQIFYIPRLCFGDIPLGGDPRNKMIWLTPLSFWLAVQLTYTTLFGAYCTYLFLRTGSLSPPISAHPILGRVYQRSDCSCVYICFCDQARTMGKLGQ
ncbi:hypothetical protein JOM56_001518 [Amanita muscaria]